MHQYSTSSYSTMYIREVLNMRFNPPHHTNAHVSPNKKGTSRKAWCQ